jgi:hypothetical protein
MHEKWSNLDLNFGGNPDHKYLISKILQLNQETSGAYNCLQVKIRPPDCYLNFFIFTHALPVSEVDRYPGNEDFLQEHHR